MPKTTTPAFTQAITHTPTQFLTADSTNFKTIAAGGINDSRIIHITISSTDTASNIAYFSLSNGTTTVTIAHCNVPNGSGTNGINNSVAVLSASSFLHKKLDNNSNPYFELATGWTLRMRLAIAVTAAMEISVLVTQEDY